MIPLFVVEAVTEIGASSVVQIRGIAVDQFPTVKVKFTKKLVRTSMHLLNWIVTLKPAKWNRVNIYTNIAYSRRLAQHNSTAAKMGFNIRVMWWHQGNNRLTQS